jgi:hypothetical protein
MLRARSEALGDGSARQLRCGASVTSATVNQGSIGFAGCSFYVAAMKGMAPTQWIEESGNVQASSHALIWNITSKPSDSAANAGPNPMTGFVSITFYPNGVVSTATSTPTGATVYVCDKTGKHQYKVYAFPGTGLSKLVNTW